MTSSVAAAAAAAAPSTTTTATKPPPPTETPPVTILPTPAAQTYAHVHPALLLAWFALRFRSLVADPVATLANDVPVAAGLQVAYLVVCLPPAGSSPQRHGDDAETTKKATPSSTASSASPSAVATRAAIKPHRRKQGQSSPSSGMGAIISKLTASFLSLLLTALLGAPVLAILLILFGAPFTTHLPHTFLCAAHMALLCVLPLVYVHGVDGHIWRQVWALERPMDTVWGGALGTAVGAWLGAVPIPLDWDRPWQAYPITILTGAYIGYVAGSLIARTPLVYGKKIEFSESESDR